ncbi:MAG: nitroreductase/quinone reductase family protein [Actinomycetota bacterium]
MSKRTSVVAFQKYFLNPLTKLFAGRGGLILLETTGRKSGKRRRTPMGGRREGDTVWIVAEQGTHANYVRNIQADPRVRVKVGGKWRTGTARTVPSDDARARSKGSINGFMVRVVGTELLSVRVDLDPV